MDVSAVAHSVRRPRFRRASEPPAFRVTEGDVEIMRHVGQRRLVRSSEIAALVGRSLDRTNDRLLRLFHAGYLDRPRAQLDRFPTSGTGKMVYALADRGARLLRDQDGMSFRNMEWSRKNREAGRPFIEHQLEIVNFEVALIRAADARSDIQLRLPRDLIAETYGRHAPQRPFALRANVSHRGIRMECTAVPDFVFSLLPDRSRHNFTVEIDRGTMPVTRSDPKKTSFEKKMRAYLGAHATKQHIRQFGWQSFRVLTVTTDVDRMRSMQDALRDIHIPHSPAAGLFYFATFEQLRGRDPLAHEWRDGCGRPAGLI